MSTREQIMEAAFARVQAVVFQTEVNGQTTWVTTARRLRLWGDVPPDQQPYAALVTHQEMDEYRTLGLSRIRLHLGIWCYSRTDDPETVGQIDLDSMFTGIKSAFAPDDPASNLLTLGGLVYWCRIEGRVFKDPGDIDNQAMMIVPILVEFGEQT